MNDEDLLQTCIAEGEAIINAIADALIIYGSSGEIVRMNPVAAKAFAYTPEECRQTLAERTAHLQLETVDGNPLAREQTPFWRALQGEKIAGFVARCRCAGRQPIWMSISAAPVQIAGNRQGAVVTMTDITPLHQLQEQRELYLSTVSHDLRGPLTVIHGHAQLLQDWMLKAGVEESVRSSLEAILQGTQAMESMIDALVDSAYLESGQLQLRRQPVRLSLFVDNLLQRTRTLFDGRLVEKDFPSKLPPVMADPVRLERILMNLLTNAVKYSSPGTPVRVEGRRVKGAVSVAVSDRGRGIAAEDLPHIFERFHRTRKGRKGKGIGLGLYNARLLVEAHGGSIRAASEPGEGSVFVFTLPVAPEKESADFT